MDEFGYCPVQPNEIQRLKTQTNLSQNEIGQWFLKNPKIKIEQMEPEAQEDDDSLPDIDANAMNNNQEKLGTYLVAHIQRMIVCLEKMNVSKNRVESPKKPLNVNLRILKDLKATQNSYLNFRAWKSSKIKFACFASLKSQICAY